VILGKNAFQYSSSAVAEMVKKSTRKNERKGQKIEM